MRLINTSTGRFEEFIGRNIPKYAILSHTWGKDEVTCHDINTWDFKWRKKDGLFYVERVGRAQADGSEIGYGVLIYFFHRSPSFSFSFIHHCFGVFCMIRTIRSFPTHRPCIYILLSSAGTSSLDVYHALEPDLQPKKLCSSIPNVQRALRCPPYGKYKG